MYALLPGNKYNYKSFPERKAVGTPYMIHWQDSEYPVRRISVEQVPVCDPGKNTVSAHAIAQHP
jgi:hypothetical protein